METLVQKANRLIQEAQKLSNCKNETKSVKRKLEDLESESGLSGGQLLGVGIAAVGVVAGFFTFGLGSSLILSGLTVVAVSTDAKVTRIRKAIKELERAVEDLEECLS